MFMHIRAEYEKVVCRNDRQQTFHCTCDCCCIGCLDFGDARISTQESRGADKYHLIDVESAICTKLVFKLGQ